MSANRRLTRRTTLKLGAAATALPLVHIRSAGAAGRLNVAMWDHWVPTADPAMKRLAVEWGKQNNVEIRLDFLAEGSRITNAMAAEAKAKAGHDVFSFDAWTVQQHADELLPVDDVMQGLIGQYGKLGEAFEYLGMAHGHWLAVPVSWGSLSIPPCARISLLKRFANVDVQAWYPAHESTPDAGKDWTYDKQLEIAEACFKAGYPTGFGCGPGVSKADAIWATTFGAFGAELMDASGNIAIESDNVMTVMEYCAKMVKFMPADAATWTDSSSNRALISGKTALIWNPPSAWAVAKRYAPQVAEDCWTFPNPRGPSGRLVPHRPTFWGIWSFANNQSAAKDFITFMSQRKQVETLAVAAEGYDIPPFESMSDLQIWSEVGPPKGTLYNYPIRPWHQASYYVPGSSAPPRIAAQILDRAIHPGMVARLMSGQTIKQSIDWAKSELEQIVR